MIIAAVKKGPWVNCNSYRGISLLPTVTSVSASIMHRLLIPVLEITVCKQPASFGTVQSCICLDFTLRQLLKTQHKCLPREP